MAPAASVVLLALCFGLGWANLFVQISATTVAAKEWGTTALSLLPYGAPNSRGFPGLRHGCTLFTFLTWE